MSESPIRFENVRRRFGDQVVLDGLDLEVRPGEIYALLGRNGAGKTTALRILLGFLAPHAGRALVFGRESRDLQPADRGRIGYLGEGHHLPPNMSARRILAFEAATRPTFDRGLALDMLGRCRIPERRPVFFLSRGQRAQLALIIVIASRPELLIFDDPALGLDTLMRRELLDVMIDFLAERGGSVLFSSHILGDVERIADRVGILHDGAILVEGRVEELRARITRRRLGGVGPIPDDPRILRESGRPGVRDLLLCDEDDALLAALRTAGDLGEPETLHLEDLFVQLVGDRSPVLAGIGQKEESC